MVQQPEFFLLVVAHEFNPNYFGSSHYYSPHSFDEISTKTVLFDITLIF